LEELQERVAAEFGESGINIARFDVRSYPDEIVFIVSVSGDDLPAAAELGNTLDSLFGEYGFEGFITVKRATAAELPRPSPLTAGVHDPRAVELTRLITGRSRTSEAQPSLAYISDVQASIAAVAAARHHLVFGRRGAGKTALLLEARRRLEADGHLSLWLNLQTLRHEPVDRIYLIFAQRIVEEIQMYAQRHGWTSSMLLSSASKLLEAIERQLSADVPDEGKVRRVIPRLQVILKRFLESSAERLYIFVDDFYYVPRSHQPLLLDMFHGSIRDADAWLKIASIRHLTRWFDATEQLGLESMHDADHVDLDVTLQDPMRAKRFLERVLDRYARHVGVARPSALFSGAALDRLVLACGAVPRDYLLLSASAVTLSRKRDNAKLVGVQDVNQAAGEAAKAKLQELEDDLAADTASATRTVHALDTVRRFCLEEQQCTYFRIDFKDRERHQREHEILMGLMEVRLAHLVDPSVSDGRRAGERAEVYMLDLSQYSGARLKKGVRVLDLERGMIVSRRTGEKGAGKHGRTPLEVIGILRASPVLALELLGDAL